MAKIIPFCALRYGKKNVSDLICPPYDVVPKSDKEKLLEKSSHNAIRIELPDDYSLAKQHFDNWKKENVLIKDVEPSFYLYEQSFSHSGKKYTRCGFFALLKTEKFGKNIFPHEKTHSAPKVDRLNLLKATGMSTSPIFCLFSDTKKTFLNIAKKIKKQPAVELARLSNASEKMWKVSDKKTIDILENLMRNNKLLIADGHHRYETFYQFTNGGYVLTFLCPFEDKGLVILPTHRLINDWTEEGTQTINKFFKVVEKNKNWDFKFYTKGKFVYLKVPQKFKGLAIDYLHSTILKDKKVDYTKDDGEAIARVDSGEFISTVIVKPLSIKELKTVVDKNRVLPQKSTYFYPKVSTGFVFNEINKVR